MQYPPNAAHDARDFHVWDELLLPFTRLLLRSGYISLTVEGAERGKLRPEDSIIYVANHSGFYSLDALLIAFTIHEWFGRKLVPYTATQDSLLGFPWLGRTIARVGGIPASLFKEPKDCPTHVRHVGMFAEGAAGNSKPFYRAYQLRRFRTGFVRLALARGASVVPVVVIGGEECAPVAARVPLPWGTEGRTISLPLSPLPLPSRFKIRFLPPLRFPHPAEAAEDHALCTELANSVRAQMQAVLDQETRARPLAKLGRSLAWSAP